MKIKMEQQRVKAETEEKERQARIAREEAMIKRKQAEFNQLEQKLNLILPMVNEANLMGIELKRDIKFTVKMMREMPEHDTASMADCRTDVMVRCDNKEDGWYCLWDADKFESRVQMMREVLNTYFDTEVLPDFTNKQKDPWYDPADPLQVGTSYIQLKPLSYAIGSGMTDARVLSSEGKGGNRGVLRAQFEICDKKGGVLDDSALDEMYGEIEGKEDLLGKELNMFFEIESLGGLPDDLCTNPFVTYTLKHEVNEVFSTPEVQG